MVFASIKKILNEINILRKMGKSRRDPEIFTFDNTAKKVSKKEFFLVCIFSYYSIHLLVQSELGKLRTRDKSVFGHFSRSVKFQEVVVKVRSKYFI